MIIKLQVPSADEDKVLIYDVKRTFKTLVPYTPEIKALMGEKQKEYFYATLLEGGKLALNEIAKGQYW